MSDKINEVMDSNKDYTAPEYKKAAFHCPHCNICAHHEWRLVYIHNMPDVICDLRAYLLDKYCGFNLRAGKVFVEEILKKLTTIHEGKSYIQGSVLSFCNHCREYSIWVNQKIVYPHLSTTPLPIAEMPESVKELYNEARVISNQSPKGACALLRLAIQFLVKELGEDEKNLNKAIGNLVKKGLPKKIQKALDTVRVIGNNSVHPPGEINIKDNPKIANTLFMLVNFICEKMITENKEIDAIYDSLPSNKRKAITERDNRMDT